MTHTKGPWEYYNQMITAKDPQVNGDDWISSGYMDKMGNGGYIIAESIVNKHNGYLLAAAPDLLEALESILPQFIELYETFDPDGEIATWGQWRELAQNAIKRAKGEI